MLIRNSSVTFFCAPQPIILCAWIPTHIFSNVLPLTSRGGVSSLLRLQHYYVCLTVLIHYPCPGAVFGVLPGLSVLELASCLEAAKVSRQLEFRRQAANHGRRRTRTLPTGGRQQINVENNPLVTPGGTRLVRSASCTFFSERTCSEAHRATLIERVSTTIEDPVNKRYGRPTLARGSPSMAYN